MDDLVHAVLTTTDRLVVSALGGNAAAGGVMLALAADEVWCRAAVVLNPHYRLMGLYGSEYWTYSLPAPDRPRGGRTAHRRALPVTAAAARRARIWWTGSSTAPRRTSPPGPPSRRPAGVGPRDAARIAAKKARRERDEAAAPARRLPGARTRPDAPHLLRPRPALPRPAPCLRPQGTPAVRRGGLPAHGSGTAKARRRTRPAARAPAPGPPGRAQPTGAPRLSSSATSTAATTTAAANGTFGRLRAEQRPAHRHGRCRDGGEGPGHPGRARPAEASNPVAATSGTGSSRRRPAVRPAAAASRAPPWPGHRRCPAAHRPDARRPRADAAAVTTHQAGHGRPGSPSATKAGSDANPTAYGSQDSTVAFSPRLYAQPAATPSRWTAPARRPAGERQRQTERQGGHGRGATDSAALTAPSTTALHRRPTARSRAASTASLLQPIDNCPVSTAPRPSARVRARSCPAATASPPTRRVTATVGPG